MIDVMLNQVSKTYPSGVQALQDLDLSVAGGELLVLVGPSGSGKSTTLRLIAGLETPTGGSLAIGGRDVTRVPARDRNVALVFQRPSLYPHLTVADNLAFGARLRLNPGPGFGLVPRWLWPSKRHDGRRREEELRERVAEVARLLGLAEMLDRRPAQLSGGQQQRVALGRALVRRPDVLLLDEPLSHLEPRLRMELRRELHLLRRQIRATMVYVTHDQLEALTLGDRVAVLDRGVVQQVDRPTVVYERPRNRFVAGFLGWPPMNFVDGRLRPEGGGLVFQGPGWSWTVPPRKITDWTSYQGRAVTLGLRPDAVRPGRGDDGPCSLRMEVVLTEYVGGETLVTLRHAGWTAVGKAGPDVTVADGQLVDVRLDMDRGHLFDGETGTALRGADG